MRMIDLLNDLDARGALRALWDAGMLNSSTYTHREIYLAVDAQQRQGVTRSVAVTYVSERCGASERAVWLAISKMELPAQ